jgi:hypothetical protein
MNQTSRVPADLDIEAMLEFGAPTSRGASQVAQDAGDQHRRAPEAPLKGFYSQSSGRNGIG